ncbi:MAG: cytochrome-c oxidase, cbb3-type subunit II [Granulosicoccus sp.]|nr:cytochrome-c oxidase, cbb3-type subunit II [Granulosicoccus sp.]
MSLQRKIEQNVSLMIILVVLVVSVGGMIEILPLFSMPATTQPVKNLKPYSPLALTGRDIYIREGCVSCHSQMIRPLRAETERYGHYSVAGEFFYDRPFLWGSKRTGPDLARVGGRYSDDWHRVHLVNPRDVVPDSIMPGYPWLESNKISPLSIQPKMLTLRKLGHPYTDEEIAAAPDQLRDKTEMDAIISYLQGLGVHIKMRR